MKGIILQSYKFVIKSLCLNFWKLKMYVRAILDVCAPLRMRAQRAIHTETLVIV